MAEDVYLGTVDRMEPDIAMVDRDAALASIAVSLKRIADAHEYTNSVLTELLIAVREK